MEKTEKKTRRITRCDENDHNFTIVADIDTRKDTPDGTDIYRTIFCTKCGTETLIKVAAWGKRKAPQEKF